MSTTVMRQLVHKLQSWQYSCLLRNGGDMRQLNLPLCPLCGPSPPREIMPTSRPSRTKPQFCQRQPCQNHRPCCLPPPALHCHIWAQSSIPTGGGHSFSHSTSPTVAAPITTLSVVKDKPLRIRHRAQPLCRTGRCHHPCAPSPLDKVLPSSPIPTLGGGFTSCAINNQQTVRRCHRPCHCHGCHHQPRAPDPTCGEALPSHPHPALGGTSTLTIVLGTSLRVTYEMYPYRESHATRALSSQECQLYIRYLVTTRICM